MDKFHRLLSTAASVIRWRLVHNEVESRRSLCRLLFCSQIQTYSDVYSWVNETLFPNLYSYGWYNGDPPNSWRDMQQMNDHVTIRLGIGRLRQLRIKDGNYKRVTLGITRFRNILFAVIDLRLHASSTLPGLWSTQCVKHELLQLI